MKMAKPSQADLDAPADLLALLNQVDCGKWPSRNGDLDAPDDFDPDNPDHLRELYDAVVATLERAPNYPGRVIGGMCYVIMFHKNEIVDPHSATIDLHPRLVRALQAEQAVTSSAPAALVAPGADEAACGQCVTLSVHVCTASGAPSSTCAPIRTTPAAVAPADSKRIAPGPSSPHAHPEPSGEATQGALLAENRLLRERLAKLEARFAYGHIGHGRNGYRYEADPVPGDDLDFNEAVDALAPARRNSANN